MPDQHRPVAYVLGASGFVGSSVRDALLGRGADVRAVRAPRLVTHERDVEGLKRELESPRVQRDVVRLRAQLADADVVVNAAGLAEATSRGDALFGADALLPGVVAAAMPASARLVHVSSAAVQGRRGVLDESLEHQPFSPYSRAKALGELMVLPRGICFRPTSVHGPGRGVTNALARLCSSPLASVAGPGTRPTPQVQVANAGAAIAFAALFPGPVPSVVLQPSEGLTTAGLVRQLGGREPWHLPDRLASASVRGAHALGARSGLIAGLARRVEMLWFGQAQAPGWLEGRWAPPCGPSGWEDLRR